MFDLVSKIKVYVSRGYPVDCFFGRRLWVAGQRQTELLENCNMGISTENKVLMTVEQ